MPFSTAHPHLAYIRDFPSLLAQARLKTDNKSRSVEKQAGFKLHMTSVVLQVCSVFYLATNTNSTLGGFFYHYFIQRHLYLPIFAARFAATFEKLAKTCQFLKAAIQDHISISFLIYAVVCDVRKYKPSQIYKQFKVHSSKDRLETKILSWFSELPNEILSLVLLSWPKDLT